MLPVIALVGRPNVGKSTLFNRLTRSRDALVADTPGLTRDRKYGDGKMGDRPFIVIDTGGLTGDTDDLEGLMAQQSWQAVEEADLVLFLVDGRDGLTAGDEIIAAALRRTGKSQLLVVNKTDGVDAGTAMADFFALGMGEPQPIAAAHGRGVTALINTAMTQLPVSPEVSAEAADDDRIRVAVVGRPNVGKSTLINRMLGEERVLAFDMPGTTRDSIFIPFDRDETAYTLIDTAGVRRRARVNEAIEKFSVIKTLQAIDAAHVVILVLDAQLEISEQDASLAGYVAEKGRALILAVNKWDGLDAHDRSMIVEQLNRRLPFLDFATTCFISALHGSGVGDLFPEIEKAYASAMRELPTPALTAILEKIVQEHQPPLVRGRRIKLRYAHQGGRNPPLVVIHGNQTERVPATYKRYLENAFRAAMKLSGTPIRIEFKTGTNPYKGRKNKLTGRQVKRKSRMMRHVKKKH
ncbi:MAG TPA: ribosome biogenesis GTPase Der [Gammaproteobacteria bacterium]|nr:ribosome biogenesis GTPase Der [Gammaproteobacteria bacterium]